MGRGPDGSPCSGLGSRGDAASRYVELVSAFIDEHKIDLILDIGCGDFHVGRAIIERLQHPVQYTGADVSQFVIARNREQFSAPNVTFACLDAAKDPLPQAQLPFIWQVLQHLSNGQIGAILNKLAPFRWVLITEHYPDDAHLAAANLDKPHGPDTRLVDLSAVFIDRPPFSLKGARMVLEVDGGNIQPGISSYIRTWLVEPSKTEA